MKIERTQTIPNRALRGAAKSQKPILRKATESEDFSVQEKTDFQIVSSNMSREALRGATYAFATSLARELGGTTAMAATAAGLAGFGLFQALSSTKAEDSNASVLRKGAGALYEVAKATVVSGVLEAPVGALEASAYGGAYGLLFGGVEALFEAGGRPNSSSK